MAWPCKHFHIRAKGGALSSCETLHPACEEGTSADTVSLKSEVTPAFKAYRMSDPLVLRKSLLDFAENVKSWHVGAVSPAYIFTAAEQVNGQIYTQM